MEWRHFVTYLSNNPRSISEDVALRKTIIGEMILKYSQGLTAQVSIP